MMKPGLILFVAGLTLFACKSLHKKPSLSAEVEVSAADKETYQNAEAAYQANQLNEAKTLFEQYVKSSPKPAAGYYRLACICKSSSDKSCAKDYIQKAIQADSSNYYYALFLAGLYEDKRELLAAADIYYQLALKYPDHWSFFSDGAKLLQRARNYEKLIAHCNHWEGAFGLKEEIVKYRCAAWEQQKEYAKVAADWQRMVQKYPYRREYKLLWAAALQQAGNQQEAANIYASMLESDPENPELLSALCSYYQNAGDKALLWKHVNKVVASRAMDVWQKHQCLLPFLNNLPGNNYYDSLEPMLLKMCEINGDDHRSWLFLADWYFARKDFKNAIQGFGKTLQMFQNDYQVWAKYTESLDRLGAYPQLVAVADSMLELFPANPTIYLISATAYMGMEKWGSAQERIENGQAYAIDGDIVLALKLSLAQVLNSSGKKAEAYTMIADLNNQYPKNAEVFNIWAKLYAQNNENIEQAVTYINNALEMQPNKPEYLYTQATVLQRKNQWDGALAALRASYNADPRGKTLELMGDIQLQMGNKTAAMESWQRAQELGYRTASLVKKLATQHL